MNYLGFLIGAGQLAVLCGIFLRLGALRQRMIDHEAQDDRRFTHLERTLECQRL